MAGNPFLQQMGKEIPDKGSQLKPPQKKKKKHTKQQQDAIARRLNGGKGSGRN